MPSPISAFIALVVSGGLYAADISGAWTGMMDQHGIQVPVQLMLKQCTNPLSGTVSTGTGANRPQPIINPALHGSELTFSVRVDEQVLRFRLQINGPSMSGDVGVGDQVFKATFSPVGGRTSYTTGGAVPPLLIHKIEPEYTDAGRAAKLQGSVLLRVEIEPNGKISPERISVVRSLGMGLDEKAIEAVKQWRFKPANCEGRTIPMEATLEVNFRL